MRIHNLPLLRKLTLQMLKRFNPGDITIRNHYTRDKFCLHSFRHKGYWYHGAKREKATMCLFRELIQASATILEVGGHIGYITQYFSHLVGPNGLVYVFEPGTNNLTYIKQNTAFLDNVRVIQKAASDTNGSTSFYLDDLTGQNNSILPDYDVLLANQAHAHVKSAVTEVMVETIRIDTFITEEGISPDFVKIDIEGAELLALKGMQHTCRTTKPLIMVEITNNTQQVHELLSSFGYILFNESRHELSDKDAIAGNTFCLHPERHIETINKLRAEKTNGQEVS